MDNDKNEIGGWIEHMKYLHQATSDIMHGKEPHIDSKIGDPEVQFKNQLEEEDKEALNDCGYCAEATELESAFVAQLLKSVGSNVEQIQEELE